MPEQESPIHLPEPDLPDRRPEPAALLLPWATTTVTCPLSLTLPETTSPMSALLTTPLAMRTGRRLALGHSPLFVTIDTCHMPSNRDVAAAGYAISVAIKETAVAAPSARSRTGFCEDI